MAIPPRGHYYVEHAGAFTHPDRPTPGVGVVWRTDPGQETRIAVLDDRRYGPLYAEAPAMRTALQWALDYLGGWPADIQQRHCRETICEILDRLTMADLREGS